MPQGRKLLLYGGLAMTAVIFAGDSGMRKFVDGPLEMAERRQTVLRKNINTRQQQLQDATNSLDVLDQLRERSLPSDPHLARSRYQAWLLKLIEQAGLKGPNVDSGDAQNHKGLYQTFTFTVRGRGTLAQVTEFLYLFYDAGHLHKIRSLTLNPMQEQVDLSLTIEALSLKGSSRDGQARPDELTMVSSESLAYSSLTDYQTFVQRDLFRAGGTNQAARSTVLTAITSDVQGRREVWFRTGKGGQTLVVGEDGTLTVDTLTARVIEIQAEKVIIELDGQRRSLTVGKSLAEATRITAEA